MATLLVDRQPVPCHSWWQQPKNYPTMAQTGSPDAIRALAHFLLSNNPGITLLTNEEAQVVAASDRAREFLGMTNKVAGRRLETLLPQACLNLWRECLETTQGKVGAFPWGDFLEQTQIAKFSFRLNCTVTVITGQKWVLLELTPEITPEEHKKELTDVAEGIGKLLDPLTVIRGYCEILLPTQQDGKTALLKIESNAQRLTSQIMNLRTRLNSLASTSTTPAE